MLITPLNTAIPTIRRALSRSPSATGSSHPSIGRRFEIARDEKVACAPDGATLMQLSPEMAYCSLNFIERRCRPFFGDNAAANDSCEYAVLSKGKESLQVLIVELAATSGSLADLCPAWYCHQMTCVAGRLKRFCCDQPIGRSVIQSYAYDLASERIGPVLGRMTP